jgi:hypothetical protein
MSSSRQGNCYSDDKAKSNVVKDILCICDHSKPYEDQLGKGAREAWYSANPDALSQKDKSSSAYKKKK